MIRVAFFFTMLTIASVTFSQTVTDGQKLMYYERWNGAEQLFDKMIKSDPSNLDAYYWLTEAHLEDKNLTAASDVQKRLETYLSAHPGTQKSNLDKVAEAELYLQSADSAKAILIFDDLLKDTKEKDPTVLIAIANAWLHTKSPDYQKILYLLDKAERKDKNNPEIFSMRGDVYRRLNNGGEAVQSYQEALKKDNRFAEAAYKIGKIYLTQNNVELFLQNFINAVARDTAYAPAYYELYYYYYFRDVNKAKEYLDHYIANTDPSNENEYMVTDLYFASSKPKEAIEHAKALLAKENVHAQPRLYKLIAYSYDQLNDSTQALQYLDQYFQKEVDTNYVAKDFELKGKLLGKMAGREQEAMQSLETAFNMDTSSASKASYSSQIVALAKNAADKKSEAKWLGMVYQYKENPTNLDLYYWGMANYVSGEYSQADSVFAQYTQKYPEHIQGFYWRAKSNAQIDSTMEEGLAIPYFQKVIEMGATDSLKNKSLLIQAYGYIGAYEANVKKEYDDALVNFEKILELDPGNADAMKYRDILKKWVKSESKPD